MVPNQSSKLEQRYVVKFLVTKKYKPCENYKRMCDMYGEAYFSKKKSVYNKLNMTLILCVEIDKISMEWKHTLW